jgi:hypothetical protein
MQTVGPAIRALSRKLYLSMGGRGKAKVSAMRELRNGQADGIAQLRRLL